MLITPLTNEKLEHVFSCMNQIKTESGYQLQQERLDAQTCYEEERVKIIEFNPDPYIKKLYANKV